MPHMTNGVASHPQHASSNSSVCEGVFIQFSLLCRMWEFSVGLYMISIWPDSLLFAALYGVVESASTVLFGPLVGQWVDRLTYVKVCSPSFILCI